MEARREWNEVVSTKNMRQIESKQSQKNRHATKMLIWLPFATSLLQSRESKVASTQSKKGNNKWGVEDAFSRRGAADKLPTAYCLEKLEKERENIRMYLFNIHVERTY
jgi:hypothetical protein